MIAPHVFEPPADDGAFPSANVAPSSSVPNGMAWARSVRVGVSLLLILHLIAIASAPWAMQPSSVLAERVFSFFQPYVDFAFLNHGYHFFAPEPGPSHVIRYELQLADGRLVTGQFPDAQVHSPRLLYHRHFMLSETANRLAVDPAQQPALDELTRSFADHLMTNYSAIQARLYLRRHYIPTPDQVADGLPLDAPELFAERPLGTFHRQAGDRTRTVPPTVQAAVGGRESLPPAATQRVATQAPQGAIR